MFRPIMAIKQPQEEIPTFIFQNQLLNCTQLLAIDNRSNRELMHRDLYVNTPRSDIQTPLNRNRNLKMAIIGRNMQFHIRINIFSNQLCCSTIFSALSLVTHTTGMTHLNLSKPNDIYICRTAALTSRRYNLNIYSTNIHTEYFKHVA